MRTSGDEGMSPGEVIAYRLYAVYCVEIARELADPGRKAALLSIAQAWLVLADQLETAGRTLRGDPHPSDSHNGGGHSHE
jgi:hypothetical protein